jgi:PAS domain S-box-containing protein
MISLSRISDRLNSIGSLKTDPPMQKAAKSLLIYLALLISMAGLVWGILLLYFGLSVAASIPISYVIFSFLNIVNFYHRKNFKTTSVIQITLNMVLPFLLQWQLGGFFASGCVMLWSTLSLVATVVLLGGRWVYRSLFLFICLVTLSYFFDPYFIHFKPTILTVGISRLLLTLNILLITCIVFVLAKMKVDRDNLVQEELQKLYVDHEKNLSKEQEVRRQLQTSENRYRNLVEESRVLICLHDLQGILITVNKPGAEILGYHVDELSGKKLSLLLPSEFQADFQTYLKYIAEHKTFESFLTVLTKQGEKRIFLFRNTLIAEPGQEPYVMGSAQDVTEWRRLENRERTIRKELQMIVSSIDDFVIEFDAARRFKNFWCRDESKLSRPTSYYIGKTLEEAFSYAPAFAERAQHVYEKVLISGKPYSVEVDNGFLPTSLSYLIRLNPIRERDGSVKRCTALVTDITPRKLAERKLSESFQALKAAKEEAENSNRLKTIFLGSLSHEVRTPLQGILGFAEIIESQVLGEEKRRQYLKIIKKRTIDLQDIIDSLLDMASLESGEIKPIASIVDINKLVEDAFSTIYQDNAINAKKIELTLENSLPANSEVFIDSLHFKQVVINMIKNGIKFTDQGSVVFRCQKLPTNYLFSIVDTGIGIAPEKMENIFEAFRQAHEGLSRSKGGIGLGLAICKKMVDMWNGVIKVESAPGKGSIFSFTIPITTALTES